MKYIIYWALYMSSLEQDAKNISGTLLVDEPMKQVTTYLYPVGYITANITYSDLRPSIIREDKLLTGYVIAGDTTTTIIIEISETRVRVQLMCQELKYKEIVTLSVK